MNPLSLLMSGQMQPQAPDYAMPGPAPDMDTAAAMMRAQQMIPNMPPESAPSTDDEIFRFIEELRAMRDDLPPALKMKLDKVLMSIEQRK